VQQGNDPDKANEATAKIKVMLEVLDLCQGMLHKEAIVRQIRNRFEKLATKRV